MIQKNGSSAFFSGSIYDAFRISLLSVETVSRGKTRKFLASGILPVLYRVVEPPAGGYSI
jgi:hypothetical protein